MTRNQGGPLFRSRHPSPPSLSYRGISKDCLRLDTGDTQKSLRFPPNHFCITQNVFYYLLAPRSDIIAGGRYTWHPLHKWYVRLTPTHCFTLLLLRITPALLLSWLSGCPMLAIAFSWSRWHAVPSARGNVTCTNAIFQLHDLVFFSYRCEQTQ